MAWRWRVVMNLRSGTRDQTALVHEIARGFAAHGVEPPVEIVHGRDVAAATRRALHDGASIVVAGGGDGTISTVASVLGGTDVALGVLPLGTLNHFAKDLQIPLGIDAAIGTIVAGHTTAVDMADLNGQPFINNASIGLYPRMVWERDRQRRRGRRKWLALAVAAGRVWRHYRRVRVVLQQDGRRRSVHTPFVFVGNNEYAIEGLKFGGRRRLDGGLLHVTMAPGMTRGELVRGMLAALAGRLHDIEHFESLAADRVAIESRRRQLGVTLDGELRVVQTPLAFSIRRGALRVLVPAP
jgi:YegS/Rv2252/BmrU family lipid kinase